MDSRIEKLRDMGCDVEEAMERFLDDEEFYLECVGKVLCDEQFDKLKTALENEQTQDGFDCAHTLKGLAANVGLVSLEEKLSAIVEPLRAGKEEDFTIKYQDLVDERAKYVEIIAK